MCGYRQRTGEWTAALRISDIISREELRQTPHYEAFWRGNLEHSLGFGLPPQGAVTRTFSLFRFDDHEFTDRDLLVTRVLQPHLERRGADAEMAARAAAAFAAVEDEASVEARFVVLCSAGGVIEFASPYSRRLLKRYLGIDNGRLPARY